MGVGNHEIDEDIDRLFALAPEQFTAARDELVNRLKRLKRVAEASEVRRLRRPTVAAWVVNVVARGQPEGVQQLLAAGSELRQAQRKALSGVRGGSLRQATDRRRRAVGSLVKAAEQFLDRSHKGSAGTIEAVRSTFEAASVDPGAADQLKAARLTKEITAVGGFGSVTGLEVAAPPREKVPGPDKKKREQEAPARAELEAAKREEREREKQAVDARRRAIKARAEAERSAERAERLERSAVEARRAAREAAGRARQAEADARRAEAVAMRVAEKATELR